MENYRMATGLRLQRVSRHFKMFKISEHSSRTRYSGLLLKYTNYWSKRHPKPCGVSGLRVISRRKSFSVDCQSLRGTKNGEDITRQRVGGPCFPETKNRDLRRWRLLAWTPRTTANAQGQREALVRQNST